MRLLLSALTASALAVTTLPAQAAAPLALPDQFADLPLAHGGMAETLWLAKEKDKPGKGPKKPEKAKGKPEKEKAKGKPEKAENGPGKAKGKPENPGNSSNAAARQFDDETRSRLSDRIAVIPAPAGRDMLAITGLALLGGGVVAATLPEDAGLRYLNCPPGLAKKDPPCVPPGLAKKGVTYEEWAGYDRARLDTLWLERREDVLRDGRTGDARLLLLTSERIATLYGLAPAPAGQRYALIDGMPVLLDEKDYNSLLLVNELAQVVGLGDGIDIAPTAALSQADLMRLYRLPPLDAGQNYAVLNGQIIRLTDSEYETLQLIRIARAVL